MNYACNRRSSELRNLVYVLLQELWTVSHLLGWRGGSGRGASVCRLGSRGGLATVDGAQPGS